MMNSRCIPFGVRLLGMWIGLSLVVGCGQKAQPSPQPTRRSSNQSLGAAVAKSMETLLATVMEIVSTSTEPIPTPTIPIEAIMTPTVNPLPPVAQPSPGTDRIAYVQTFDKVVGEYDIYTAKPDGSDPKQVTNSPALDTEPAWSPDSQSIVFVSTLDSPSPWDCTSGFVEFKCNFDIYTISATEANATPQRLTTSDNFDRDPDWSPDGSQIVYSSRVAGAPFSFIAVMNADGSGQRALTAPTAMTDLTPRWSPDGTTIAFTRADEKTSQVWVMNADGSDARQLLAEGAIEGKTMRPDWSPDGTKIALILSKRGSSLGRIVVANADGSNPQVIADPRTILGYSPAWSSDNNHILYVTPYEDIPELSNLGVTDLSGTEINPMLLPPGFVYSAPAWSLGTQ